jgi:hypothetical protein
MPLAPVWTDDFPNVATRARTSYATRMASPSPWCAVLELYHGACRMTKVQGVRVLLTAARSACSHTVMGDAGPKWPG